MSNIEFENIFLPHKKAFLDSVSSSVNEFNEGIVFNRAAFPMFEDELFWKQNHYINLMEQRIRTHLATGVLIDLLRSNGFDIIEPEFSCYLISPNVFEETNIKFQFAIKNEKNDSVIIVRYSDIPYDTTELSKAEDFLCHSYRFSHSRWIVLLWDDKDYLSDDTHILLKDFFEEFLTLELYDLYSENVTKTIKEAESLIGYQTIVRFTTTNVHRLIYTQYVTTIRTNYVEKKYGYISSDYYIPSEFNTATGELSASGKKDVFDKYISCNRYLALIGSENYAKSFITAEFLFNTYKGDEFFDFTAIAACYAKAVEQLLLKITMNFISEKKPNDYVNIRHKDKSPQQICIKSKTTDEWRKQFNTLGSLNYFWLDNKDLTILSDVDRFESAALIHRFTFECRNQPFHSEPLSWLVVERLRKNAFMVLQLVLGAIKVNNNNGLGIIDDEFDRFFSALIKHAKHARLLMFIFGEVKIWVKPDRADLHTPIVYDANQRIRTSTIKFIVDEAVNSPLRKGESIYISDTNIPDKAFYKGRGGLVEIEW